MSDADLPIERQEPPDPRDRQQLTEALLATLAEAHGEPHFRSVGLFLRGERGELVGGLTGRLRWGWLYIEALWVADHLRGRGQGGRLLREAESFAREHGGIAVRKWLHAQ